MIRATASAAEASLKKLRNPKKAAFFPRFFKTGKGEYGEGDHFLGVTVPQVRSIVRSHRDLALPDIKKLLQSSWHEVRLLGLLILVDQSKRADTKSREKLTQFYLKNLDAVNNWDLVDASAPELLGRSLVSSKKQEVLMKLARSGQLWKERVAIVATYAFIRANAFDPTLSLAQHFLLHTHDLMHKAVGWMLREVGKRDAKALRSFLDRHAHHMPRTMLRYSIEKFGERERMAYMKKKSAKTR